MAESFSRRYVRNFATLSESDQQKLHSSKICQLGLGGLGGPLLEMLARMGFGRKGQGWIRTADGDVFEESNLNRQLFCLESNLGQPKAAGATSRIHAVNSQTDLTASRDYITPDMMPEFIQGADIVLDALGDLPSKIALRQAAAAAGLPVVSAAVAGWTGFISTRLPQDAESGLMQGLLEPGEGAEVSLGTLAPCVWLVAALQCREAIALACGHPPLFHGCLHLVDLTDGSFERIRLP